ncbi:DUF2169 domain-containing protein [Pyxidicoccus sp. 3LG]
MGDPTTENETPFVFAPLVLADEELRPLLVPVLKATFVLSPGKAPVLAEEMEPLCTEGLRWDEQDTSSYRYEPEVAFFKPATDVVLVGHAHAPAPGTRELLVSLQVGPLQKVVRVLGDRVWVRSLGSTHMTAPLPFERIPLRYERAFGGWDRSHPDPSHHRFEPRNPVGMGFREPGSRFEEGVRLPNLESPTEPLRRWGHHPAPAGVGFISPDWQPRAALAGTHDEAWARTRKPYLPRDFDRRFFNAASPGLVASGYLRGDEPVKLVHASAGGALSFRLPGLPPPSVRVRRRGLPDSLVETHLDTVIIDTDRMRLFLLWRGNLRLRREPAELTGLQVMAGGRRIAS